MPAENQILFGDRLYQSFFRTSPNYRNKYKYTLKSQIDIFDN